MKADCNRCGIPLGRIDYLEPDWEGTYRETGEQRPPLCKACWRKADEEARKNHAGRPS